MFTEKSNVNVVTTNIKMTINNTQLIPNDYYLVKLKDNSPYANNSVYNNFRFAKFNGFGDNNGWGGMDWSGDSGFSTDSWMHMDVEFCINVKDLPELLNLGILSKKL